VTAKQPSEPKKDLGGITGTGMIIATTSTRDRVLEVPARGEPRPGRRRVAISPGVGVSVLTTGEGEASVMTTGGGEGALAPTTGEEGGINVEFYNSG
jgi:glucokinase